MHYVIAAILAYWSLSCDAALYHLDIQWRQVEAIGTFTANGSDITDWDIRVHTQNFDRFSPFYGIYQIDAEHYGFVPDLFSGLGFLGELTDSTLSIQNESSGSSLQLIQATLLGSVITSAYYIDNRADVFANPEDFERGTLSRIAVPAVPEPSITLFLLALPLLAISSRGSRRR